MKAAIVGGGVIGAGWAARFALHGWDVDICDPDPQAERKVGEVLDNARAALPQLSEADMPEPGKVRFAPEIEQCVDGADWVQESAPERIEVKHEVLARITSTAPSDAVIGSSTSGFKPSDLQTGTDKPERILVAHPFNPVYLLPLVEVVPGADTAPEAVDAAREHLTAVGMRPLVVRKEVDAHIADRLLEAVWREALWLVKDDVATTEEVDDAIRFGFGLRWAQMGLFETYRIAGGEAGMAHFLAQFGPHLHSPWSKLMDVPELDDALVSKVAEQSDAQSGKHSIRDLERIRDANLVAMMQALKASNWGAGAHLREHDARLAKGAKGAK